MLRLILIMLTLFILSGCVTPSKPPEARREIYRLVNWSEVEGWSDDGTHEAWNAFLNTCKVRDSSIAWVSACTMARQQAIADADGARRFFEAQFDAYRLQQDADAQRPRDTGLITGYYEPLLHGARKPTAAFTVPLYAPPDDLLTIDLADLYPELKGKTVRGRLQGKKVVPYYSRADLDDSPLLRGKELVWVDGAIDAFFLQVQGSGRVQLDDGETIRLAYADQNGHPYRSIGRYLIDRGELILEQASAQGIRQWLQAHPERTREVLESNPSMVFFREERIVDASEGPKGALAVPLTPGRSLAVDSRYIPLGAPVFLATSDPATGMPLRRLMLAQDTGGAIKGVVRADFFWGFGESAGANAGRMRQEGRMWLLWPKGQPLPTGH
jgi:membrane-bound lytic murein transglycosylase A